MIEEKWVENFAFYILIRESFRNATKFGIRPGTNQREILLNLPTKFKPIQSESVRITTAFQWLY